MKNITPQQRLLDSELEKCKIHLKNLGAEISGISSGSPEGDIWQYVFIFSASIPPNRASAEIRVSWRHGYNNAPSNKLVLYRSSSIYREGCASSYLMSEETTFEIIGNPFSLQNIVVTAFNACKKELSVHVNTPLEFT
ncbi:hypothetical protein [Cellvibrio sp. pealriver]|uniref:hypothetical protein n=1 Tax=Cellvibrio sp. pealriver TaxID=1622269 RepID=UPI000A7D356E|nr:hypothetical protein [Cellvibrio sp. pealriver]